MATTYVELQAATALAKKPQERAVFFASEYEEFGPILSRRISDKLTEQGILNARVAQHLNISDSLMTRMRDEGTLLSASKIATICFDFFQMSVEEFVTEKQSPVILPKNLTLLAESMQKLPEKQRKKILANAKRKWKLGDIEHSAASDKAEDIFRERVKELCFDAYAEYQSLYRGSPSRTTTRAFETVLGIAKNARPSKSEALKMSQVIFLAMVSETPIDFFIVKNYARYLPIAYIPYEQQNAGAEPILVDDPSVVNLVSYYLTMPADTREEMLGQALADCWKLTKLTA